MKIKAGLYQHYKGGLYQVLGIAEHTETGELVVVYVALYPAPGPRIRVRPLTSWDEPLPSGDARFKYIGA